MTSATAQRCHIPPYSRKNGANATPARTCLQNTLNFTGIFRTNMITNKTQNINKHKVKKYE